MSFSEKVKNNSVVNIANVYHSAIALNFLHTIGGLYLC